MGEGEYSDNEIDAKLSVSSYYLLKINDDLAEQNLPSYEERRYADLINL
jgi:hypothetical protein